MSFTLENVADFSGGKDVNLSPVKMKGNNKLKNLQKLESVKLEEILSMYEESKALCPTRQNCLRATSVLLPKAAGLHCPERGHTEVAAHDN